MSTETKVLFVEINCCDKCRNIIQDKVRKMPGVDNVAIDEKENLVYVFGKIDSATLLRKVAKLGKPVQLLSADKHPMNHADGKHNSCSNKFEPRGEKGKQHSNCCCGDGRRHSSSSQRKKGEEKEEHKCEAYVPPEISPIVCRDYYCKVHPRGGRTITDRVPAENTSSFFGVPFYGGGGPSYQYPMGYGGMYGPQHPPPQFGYGRAMPRRMPHHNPFIFH